MQAIHDTSHALRLLPGADLRNSLIDFVKEKNKYAGWIVTCVGSLAKYNMRFANEPGVSTGDGFFEIISLSGTVSINAAHLHICIADSSGKTIGGRLMEGCKIYTTAEIVLVESGKSIFNREKDAGTSWNELHIVVNSRTEFAIKAHIAIFISFN
ncbi:MAG: PPC domain-containing DNA-binding protein [Ginsengibacter sp.]